MELTFSSDNMSNPQSNHFYYKIVGIHNDWILLGSNPHISLGNLKGKNKLLLKVISPNSAGQEYVFEEPIIFRKYLYETNWFRILAILFVLGIVFSLVRWAEQKKIRATVERARIKDQMATLEKKALASQMNPHFIFNSINAIQEFIYNNDDEAAINYLSKFSKIIRAVLNFSSQERIPLSEEIEFLEHYLDMQKMRFSSNFLYQFIIPERLDVHSIEIPPFMIQPHIENSIEHGLLAKKDGGEIIIELKDVDGYLHVSIDDNGIGIIAARAKKDKSKISRKSKGIALVQQRMNHMKIDHKDVDMKIIDKKETANEAGTRVELIIPYD